MEDTKLANTLELLRSIREELDNRSNAEYGPDGIPQGNWAMKLLRDIDIVITNVEAGRGQARGGGGSVPKTSPVRASKYMTDEDWDSILRGKP